MIFKSWRTFTRPANKALTNPKGRETACKVQNVYRETKRKHEWCSGYPLLHIHFSMPSQFWTKCVSSTWVYGNTNLTCVADISELHPSSDGPDQVVQVPNATQVTQQSRNCKCFSTDSQKEQLALGTIENWAPKIIPPRNKALALFS